MCGLVTPGANQEVDDENRSDEPGEDGDFDLVRHTAQNQIDRKTCKRSEAPDQARQNESTIAHSCKHILLHRDRYQGVDVVSYWREKTHRPCHVSASGRAPISRGP